MSADDINIAETFIALPWRIVSEAKARQIAQAVGAVFETQASAFFGGDSWFVLAQNCERLRDNDSAERLDVLFSLLEQFDIAFAGDYRVEPLPLPYDAEEERDALASIAYRFEHVVNLERQIAGLSAKLDAIARMIGPVDVRAVAN